MNVADYRYHFDSLAELVATINRPHVCPDNATHFAYRHDYYDDPHWFCPDRRLLRQSEAGAELQNVKFDAGVARIERLSKQLTAPNPVSRRRKLVRSDAGDELDMSRVWQGDLEHAWTASHRMAVAGPSRVLIVVNVGNLYNTKADEMAMRGATALALTSTLQEAGYVVCLQAAGHALIRTSGKPLFTTTVTALGAGDYLDIHKLANFLASGILYRAGIMELYRRVVTTPVAEATSESRALKRDHLDTVGYDKVFVIERDQAYTPKEASKWLADALEQLEPQSC